MTSKLRNEQVPNISVDCVIFGFKKNQLHVLLIKQAFPKHLTFDFQAQYALPGDLVWENESLDSAASRVLFELTGIQNIFLEQFKSFGHPERVNQSKDKTWLKLTRKEPESRVITVAYFSLINAEKVKLKPGGFSSEAKWKPMNQLPELAFDHNQIVQEATEKLKLQIQLQPIVGELLPSKFTMSDLQALYESILNCKLDKRNFRRKMINSHVIIPLDEKRTDLGNKPAQFFKFNILKKEELSHFYNLRVDSHFNTLK